MKYLLFRHVLMIGTLLAISSACTCNFAIIQTEGTASDLVDDTTTETPTLEVTPKIT